MSIHTKRQATKLALIIMTSFWLTDSFAVCGLKPLQATIGITFSDDQSSQVNTSPAYQLDTHLSELSISNEHWQFKHQYQILDYDRSNNSTPLTNGHLHALSLAYRNRYGQLNWSITPTLAASSNQIRHSHALNGSALRVDGYLSWQKPLTGSNIVYIGACASALTGDYQLLPVLGFQNRTESTDLLLAYPLSQFRFRLTPRLKLIASWSLQGQLWQVLDRNLQNRSNLHYAAKQIRLGAHLELFKHHLLEAYWQDKTEQTLEYIDRNNNTVKADIEDSNGWMVRYRYLM